MNECAAYQVFVGWHYSDTKMYFTLRCWTTKEILVLSAHQLIIFFQPFQSSIVIDSILSEAVKISNFGSLYHKAVKFFTRYQCLSKAVKYFTTLWIGL